MDESEADKLGSQLETEHNTVVHDAVLETSEMQAQTQTQLEALQQEQAAKQAEADEASKQDQSALVADETANSLAVSMQNAQLASNLQTETVLAGAGARRPAFVF